MVEELPMSQIERVGVVGCGLMGSGIAEVCARAGLDVIVREVTQGALDAGRKRIEGSLDKAARAGKLPEADHEAALARLRYTLEFGDFADRQLVVEAVIENEAEKLEVFRGSTRPSRRTTPSWPPTRRRSRS